MKFPILNGQIILDSDVILKHAHIEHDDPVFVGGTLIEGNGSELSDIDCYVITKAHRTFAQVGNETHAFCQQRNQDMCHADTDLVCRTTDFYDGTDLHLEFEYWTVEELDRLKAKILRVYNSLMSHCDSNYLEEGISRAEGLLIHRIISGIQLNGDMTAVQSSISSVAEQYGYILYRSFANNYWIFQDLVGSIIKGKPHMICHHAKIFLGYELKACNFAHGVTNNADKWILHYFNDDALSVSQELKREATKLYLTANLDSPLSYVQEVLSVVERMRSSSTKTIELSATGLSSQVCLDMLDAERERRNVTEWSIEDHELQFRRSSFSESKNQLAKLLPSCWPGFKTRE
ncbi:hypothetical protein U5922_000730 (plasmid) [Aquicoccus sp. G2-2]|uniref:hypothetical protein n=1 Tax=Aquicoccus sp. G2-2 TaxID=3092120 RepID=UPI002AE05658|nr:hypothetical protein [Aquicoccus sp. G2-2]MEA1112054.1 hypothetical protein [Aquicoccus sp. G2-2]